MATDRDQERHAADLTVSVTCKHHGAEAATGRSDHRHRSNRTGGLPDVRRFDVSAGEYRNTWRRRRASGRIEHKAEYRRRALKRIGDRGVAVRQLAGEFGDFFAIGGVAEIAHQSDRRQAIRFRQQDVEANDLRLRLRDFFQQIGNN